MFKEFQNHLMYLPLKFPISILIKTIEEFPKNSAVSYSKDYYIDGQNIQLIFFQKLPLREGKWPPKLHPGGGFFGPWSFITLKNSHQDLSNERSNFTKEFLAVGHWALKHSHFLTNYLKLQILASYNNLRIGQDSEFAKFWPRPLTM